MQVNAHLAPPGEVLAAGAREQAERLVFVLVHERERVEVGADQALDLVEEDARGVGRLLDPRERVHDPRDRVELAVADADELFCFTRASAAHHHAGRLAPAPQEDQRRDERDERGHERRPDVAAERQSLSCSTSAAKIPAAIPTAGKIAASPTSVTLTRSPLAPERRRQSCGHHQVRARQDEQRDSVEVDSLVFGAHWALGMIRRAPGGVEDHAAVSGSETPRLRLGKMGRSAYWNRRAP